LISETRVITPGASRVLLWHQQGVTQLMCTKSLLRELSNQNMANSPRNIFSDALLVSRFQYFAELCTENIFFSEYLVPTLLGINLNSMKRSFSFAS